MARLWPRVKEQFSRQFARPDVVRKMIECGMRVSSDFKIHVDDVEVDYTAVARAVGVDRRVVRQTVEQICGNPYLYSIFSKIIPLGAGLAAVVEVLGYTAVVVEAEPKSPGVLASVAEILSRHGYVVRQALADDPDMVPDAKMTLVLEGQLSGKAIEELNSLTSLKSIKIMK